MTPTDGVGVSIWTALAQVAHGLGEHKDSSKAGRSLRYLLSGPATPGRRVGRWMSRGIAPRALGQVRQSSKADRGAASADARESAVLIESNPYLRSGLSGQLWGCQSVNGHRRVRGLGRNRADGHEFEAVLLENPS